jgi:hypothetical protein
MLITALPVELIADICSHLLLCSLVSFSQTCRFIREVVRSEVLNPWRQPIARVILEPKNAPPPAELLCLQKLAIYGDLVPRQNWLWILSVYIKHFPTLYRCIGSDRVFVCQVTSRRSWLLKDMELPRLRNKEWREICLTRFLPSYLPADDNGNTTSWRAFFLR